MSSLNLKLAVKKAVDSDLRQKYLDDGIIDPNVLAATIKKSDIRARFKSIAARTIPKRTTEHYVFDAETFSTHQDILHFGMLKHLSGSYTKVMRTWEEVAEEFENRLFLACVRAYVDRQTGLRARNPNIRVWAHNGFKFDFVGLAQTLASTEFSKVDVKIEDDAEVIENIFTILRNAKVLNTHLIADEFEKVDNKTPYELNKIVYRFADELENFKDKAKVLNALKKQSIKKFVTDYKQVGLSRNENEKLIRRRNIENPETGFSPLVTFQWTVKDYGERSIVTIECRSKDKICTSGKIQLVDSIWHIPSNLASVGESLGFEKGETPIQYTDPWQWGRDNLDFNIERDEDRFLAEWHSHLDDEAVEYCERDCDILRLWLMRYAEAMPKHMPQNSGINLFPLDYMTANQLGHTLMLAHMSLTAKRKSTDGQTLVYDPKNTYTLTQNKYELDENGFERLVRDEDGNVVNVSVTRTGGDFVYKDEDELYDFIAKYGGEVPKIRVPLANQGKPAIIPNGTFGVRSEFQEAWGHIAHGGRTEIFVPVTPDGHYDLVIDANSMYPSVMADINCSLIDTNSIKRVGQDIFGKAAILERLNYGKHGRSGMYLVESAQPTNKDFIDIPCWPVKLTGEDYDSQLMFPTWEGVLRVYVSGEELKYLLTHSDIKDDNIKVVGKQSFDAPYLPFHPLRKFANSLYAERKIAQQAGDTATSLMLKTIMNSAGFGTLGQIYGETHEFSEDEEHKVLKVLTLIQRLSPIWHGWSDIDRKSNIELIKEWAAEHWRAVSSYTTYQGKLVYRLSLPANVSPHALRPWAYAITAHSRVKLHKAMICARKAGFDVAYTDTDSLHLVVPNEVEREEAIARLQDAGLAIGDDLNQWKREKVKADPNLFDASVFPNNKDSSIDAFGEIIKPRLIALAPKHYAYFDQYDNCLGIVSKGVDLKSPKMRAAMYAFSIRSSTLGDKRGIGHSVSWYTDQTENVGKFSKRNYVGLHRSEAIVLRQPKEYELDMMQGGDYLDYQLLVIHKAMSDATGIGIISAFNKYKRLKFKNRKFEDIRTELQRDRRKIVAASEKSKLYDYRTALDEANKF